MRCPIILSQSINVSDTVFVSNSGDDSTGQVGNLAKPFRTLSAALVAVKTISSPQRTISLSPGTYLANNLTIDLALYLTGSLGTTITAETPIIIYGQGSHVDVVVDNLSFSSTNHACFHLTGKSNLLCYNTIINGIYQEKGGDIVVTDPNCSLALFHSKVILRPYPGVGNIYLINAQGGVSLLSSTLVILAQKFPPPAVFGPIVYVRGDNFLYSQNGSFYIEMENPRLSPAELPLNSYNFQSISLLESQSPSNIDFFDNSLDILSLVYGGTAQAYNTPIGDYFYLLSPSSVTANSVIRLQSLGINVFHSFVNPTLNFPQDTLVNNYTGIYTDVRTLPDVGFLIGAGGTIKPQGMAPSMVEVTGPYIALLTDFSMIVTNDASIKLPSGYNGSIMVIVNDSPSDTPVTYDFINGGFQTFTVVPGSRLKVQYLASRDKWYEI